MLKSWFALSVIFLLAHVTSSAASQTFDFEGSFEGWQQQWYLQLPSPGSAGIVTLDTTLGFGDSSSLKFDLGNGHGDDGTLWIELAFSAPSGTPVNVEVDFELFSTTRSDVNNFPVLAYVGTTDPNIEADFTIIGHTGTVSGWANYSLTKTVTPIAGQVWIAVGTGVTWETHRDYWIDHVTVQGVPEPGGGMLLAISCCVLSMCNVRHIRRSRR